MRTHLLLATSATSLLLALPGFAQTKYPATLQSHAILPAMTLVSPPGDAPKELQISGRYSGPPGQRVDTPESVPAMSALSDKTAPRPTGLYKIDTAQADADGFVKKIGYIDLMDIQDPDKVSRQGGRDGKFTFPFFTIENVDLVNADHIVVGNDNNLPFSSGRALDKADDNELILLKATDLLKAK